MSKKLQIYSMKWTIKGLNNLNKSLTILFWVHFIWKFSFDQRKFSTFLIIQINKNKLIIT